MRRQALRLLGTTLFCFSILAPLQAMAAYTCSNPAICRAVCGSTTCGKIAARDPDMKALQTFTPGNTLAASADAKARKPYTCFNPAICKAVCGSPTC